MSMSIEYTEKSMSFGYYIQKKQEICNMPRHMPVLYKNLFISSKDSLKNEKID